MSLLITVLPRDAALCWFKPVTTDKLTTDRKRSDTKKKVEWGRHISENGIKKYTL